jgi:hypothetical protein
MDASLGRKAGDNILGQRSMVGEGWRAYLPAVVAGICLRLVLLAVVDYRIDGGDQVAYNHLGWNVAAHGSYSLDMDAPREPTAVRAPLLPLVIAASYRSFGGHQIPIQLFQILVTVLACCLLSRAVHKVAPDLERCVLWMTVLSPADAVYAGTYLAESLCTTFLIAGVCAPIVLRRGRYLLSGIALGAAALARDVYLMAVPFAALVCGIVALLRRRVIRPIALASATVLLGAMLVVSPWTARNLHTFHQLIPVTKGLFWYNFWIGTWERNGDWEAVTLTRFLPPESYRNDLERQRVVAAVAENDVYVREQAFRALALDRLRSEPLRVVGQWARRVPRMWVGTRFDLFTFRPATLARGQPLWVVVKAGLFGLNALLLTVALGGLVHAARFRKALLWFALPLAYDAAVYFPLHNVETRFTQPVYPFVLVFAAAGLHKVVSSLRLARDKHRHHVREGSSLPPRTRKPAA